MENQPDNETNWKELYLELIQSLALNIEDHDKRAHSRVLLPPGIELLVEIGNESYKVLDISPGGISLFSPNSLSGSSEIQIVYANIFKLNSEILYSRVDPTTTTDLGEGYRVGAKFLIEDEGYKIVAMVLQLYGSSLKTDPDG